MIQIQSPTALNLSLCAEFYGVLYVVSFLQPHRLDFNQLNVFLTFIALNLTKAKSIPTKPS